MLIINEIQVPLMIICMKDLHINQMVCSYIWVKIITTTYNIWEVLLIYHPLGGFMVRPVSYSHFPIVEYFLRVGIGQAASFQ